MGTEVDVLAPAVRQSRDERVMGALPLDPAKSA
jgi:hypothetical protein